MTAPVRPALVEGLQPLSDRYDLVLCDIWGVLHNGVKAYEAAGEALTRFPGGRRARHPGVERSAPGSFGRDPARRFRRAPRRPTIPS